MHGVKGQGERGRRMPRFKRNPSDCHYDNEVVAGENAQHAIKWLGCIWNGVDEGGVGG